MERNLYHSIITIFINCFFFIYGYIAIHTLNFYTLYLLISIFLSFIREITIFRCVFLIRYRPNNLQQLFYYSYFILFIKILNIINIFILIFDKNQFIYTDNKFLIIYCTYDAICLTIFSKINLQTNRDINLPSIHMLNNKKVIKITDVNYLVDECYICCERKGNFTILDCNHNMICGICIYKLNKCPICRCNITEILEISNQ